MRTNRIEALADAIFAIAMTLIILEFHLPTFSSEPLASEVIQGLIALIPHFLTFFLSFIILGILWIGHHNQMNYIQQSDRSFLWLNVLFFMFICLVPFSAGLLGAAPFAQPAIIFYALNLILCSSALLAIWLYALSKKLVKEEVTPQFARQAARRIMTAPVWYGLAILVSFLPAPLGMHLSHACFIIPILIFVFPGQVDRLWSKV